MNDWIKARLNEPSTWYGLGVVVSGLMSHLLPTDWAGVLAGIQYAAGGAAVVTAEKK